MLTVRPEKEQDYPAIDEILRLCFQREETVEEFNEWVLVRQIRECADYLPSLSLVAEEDGQIVGYVMFSVCRIGGRPLLALAPLAVHPEHQRRGVGAALVSRGLERGAAQGYDACLVLGGPYYRRFGFQPVSGAIHLAEGLDEHLALLELRPEAAAPWKGEVRYCAPFYDGDGNLL